MPLKIVWMTWLIRCCVCMFSRLHVEWWMETFWTCWSLRMGSSRTYLKHLENLLKFENGKYANLMNLSETSGTWWSLRMGSTRTCWTYLKHRELVEVWEWEVRELDEVWEWEVRELVELIWNIRNLMKFENGKYANMLNLSETYGTCWSLRMWSTRTWWSLRMGSTRTCWTYLKHMELVEVWEWEVRELVELIWNIRNLMKFENGKYANLSKFENKKFPNMLNLSETCGTCRSLRIRSSRTCWTYLKHMELVEVWE
jgi:hypothetical protein